MLFVVKLFSFYFILGRITAIVRCGLLLQT